MHWHCMALDGPQCFKHEQHRTASTDCLATYIYVASSSHFTSSKSSRAGRRARGAKSNAVPATVVQYRSPAALRLHLLHHFCSLIAHRFDHLNRTGISIPVSIPRRSCICLHIDAGTCRIGGSFVPAVADLTRTAGPLIQRTLLAPLWPNAEHPAISLSLCLCGCSDQSL